MTPIIGQIEVLLHEIRAGHCPPDQVEMQLDRLRHAMRHHMERTDDLPDSDCGWAADEIPVHAKVNGTTFRATYEVRDALVLLASPELGDASAALDGMAPQAVATQLLQGMAEVAMARSDVPFMRDDEVNSPSTG